MELVCYIFNGIRCIASQAALAAESQMHTVDLLLYSLNQGLILNGFEDFQLPSRNNAGDTYSFSHFDPSPFHSY